MEIYLAIMLSECCKNI